MSVYPDPLFLGLTRQPMVGGVTYPFVVLNGLGCLFGFVLSNDPKYLLCLPFLHGLAYMICLKEPLAIELIMIKGAKCSKCRNKSFYGANSYDCY